MVQRASTFFRHLWVAAAIFCLAAASMTTAAAAKDGRSSDYRWRARTNGDSTVERAGGVVLVGEWWKQLDAFPASCGHRRAHCHPLWHTEAKGFQGATVRAEGAYVAARPGGRHGGVGLYALPCQPAGHVCVPRWFDLPGPINAAKERSRPWLGAPHLFTSPVIHRGVVYVAGSADIGESHPGAILGRLYAYPSSCPFEAGCAPLWRSPLMNGIGAPLVHSGRVFMPSSAGLFTFATSCRSDGGVCAPLWHAGARIHGNSSNIMETPTIAGDEVYVTTRGDAGGGDANLPGFFGYATGCGSSGSECPPRIGITLKHSMWTSRPLVHRGSVFITAEHRGLLEFTNCADAEPGCLPRRTFGAPRVSYPSSPDPASDTGTIAVGNKLVALSEKGSTFHVHTFLSVFDSTCSHRRCHPAATFDPGQNVHRVMTKGLGLVFTVVRHTVEAIDPNKAHNGVLHTVWHWRTPDRRTPTQLAYAGRTLYVGAARKLYSVPIPPRLL